MIDNFPDIKSFKLVKLINGEDIICTIADGNPNKSGGFIQVDSPLRMQVLPKMVDGGKITESLN